MHRKLSCFGILGGILIFTLYCFNPGFALEGENKPEKQPERANVAEAERISQQSQEEGQKPKICLPPELKAPENMSVDEKVDFYFKKAREVMDNYDGDTTSLEQLAIPYSEEIIKIAPDSPYGYYVLSRCARYFSYYSGDKYDYCTIKQGALPLAKKAVELGAKSSLIHMNLAMCYSNMGKHSLALNSIDEAVNLSENEQAKGYNMVHRGIILERAGRKQEALKAYQEAETKYPLDSIAKKYLYDNLGSLYIDLRMYDQGIEYAKKRCSLTPDSPWAWHNLGVVYQKVKRYDEAINCEEKALGIMNFGAARACLSSDYTKKAVELMNKKQDLPTAEKYLLRAIEVYPENSSAHQWAAYYYLDKKDYLTAKRYLDELLKLDPGNKWGLNTLRRLEYEQGSNLKH
jgi:tetratricopeptide (TPR) repeat protein